MLVSDNTYLSANGPKWDKPTDPDYDGPLVDIWAICDADSGEVVYLAMSRGKPSLAQWLTPKSEPVKAAWIRERIASGRAPILRRLATCTVDFARSDWEDRVEAGIMERRLGFHLLGQQSAKFWMKLWHAAKEENDEFDARRKAERKHLEEGNDLAIRAALGIDVEPV